MSGAYAPVNVVLPDGTAEIVPLAERWRGKRFWLVDRDPARSLPMDGQRLDARIQALHAAVFETMALSGLTGPSPVAMTDEVAAALQGTVQVRATALEAWLLRPVGDDCGCGRGCDL